MVRSARRGSVRLAFDGDDRARFVIAGIGKLAHLRIVRAPVRSVDDQIVPVVELVGETARHDPPTIRAFGCEGSKIA